MFVPLRRFRKGLDKSSRVQNDHFGQLSKMDGCAIILIYFRVFSKKDKICNFVVRIVDPSVMRGIRLRGVF